MTKSEGDVLNSSNNERYKLRGVSNQYFLKQSMKEKIEYNYSNKTVQYKYTQTASQFATMNPSRF